MNASLSSPHLDMPGLGQGFCNITQVQRIIGIVERLRLPARHCFAQALAGGRSSKRLTVNVIGTLDETNPELSGLRHK